MSASPSTNPTVRQWVVCHTKPRCEKKFSALLAGEEITHYLPLVDSVRHYRSKSEQYQKPLFPGYVFVNSAGENRARLFQRELLVRLLPVENQCALLRQLDQVRALIASGLKLSLHPLLKKGSRVRVVSGPLYGVEGVVDNPTQPSGIIVAIDVLRQGLHVRLPIEILEPLS